MATRGYENFTQTDVTRRELKQAASAKPSKYRNVKTVIGSETFDSKREAAYWQELKFREKGGEIHELRRQVKFPLYAAKYDIAHDTHIAVHVADYVADFTYFESANGVQHVIDAKGKRLAMYILKAKWLALQSEIVVEEV